MKIVDIGNKDKPLVTSKDIKQLIEYVSVNAQLNWVYFTELKARGFTEQQALEIVKHFKIT